MQVKIIAECPKRAIRNTLEIVSVYDQEIPQSQTAGNPMAPRGSPTQPSQDTIMTN